MNETGNTEQDPSGTAENCAISAVPTVFLIDDDPDIRSSLARSLRFRGYLVETFVSAIEFLDTYNKNRPGCLILDQGMPGMSGLDLQEYLRGHGFSLPIIFITGHGGVKESVQAMKAGAVDFLEKPFRQSELIERVREALAEAQTARADCGKDVAFRKRMDRLTPREKEVVNHMLSHPSEVSSKEIARHLNISPRTVDNHRARILEKLEVNSVVELVHIARNVENTVVDFGAHM